MDIIYISKNMDKFNETKRLFDEEIKKLNSNGINLNANLIRMEKDSINEIQTDDIDKLIADKIRKAYDLYKRPVLVEHTSLNIECLNGYPDIQTSEFWKIITKNDEKPGQLLCQMVDMVCKQDDKKSKKAYAKTIYCYCDGKNIIKAEGRVDGLISNEPIGDSKFQWDILFIPDKEGAENKTFAQLENNKMKDEFSMRSIAMQEFVCKLKDKINIKEYNIGIHRNHIEEIADKIIDEKLVLFIGAGVSASIKMASWNSLIKDLGKEIGFQDDEIFLSLGDNLELAEYYNMENKSDLARIVEYFKHHSKKEEIHDKITDSKIYKVLANLNVKTIYTTNYENLIETAFDVHNSTKKYNIVNDLKTLNNSKVNDVEIIKLHGDLDKSEDMVLTQTSYYKRYDFENCLDLKLRNDLLTKSVLFIGYSFRDPNIKYMMHRLNSMWEKADIKNRPKSYIFLTENNPVQRKIIENNNNMVTIVAEKLDKSEALYEFLNEISKNVEVKNKEKNLIKVR